MNTATISAVTTATGTVVLLVLVGLLLGREIVRQRGGRPRRHWSWAATAMALVLGSDMALRFVTLAHGR
jgi:hypothetical protein